MERLLKGLARTPLYHWHVAQGARFVCQNGWQIPASYSDAERETAAVRAGLGLVDVSAFAKIGFRGRGVATLTHALVGDSPPALKPRAVVAFDAEGPVWACRLTEEHLLLLASTTNTAGLRDRLAALRRELPVVESEGTQAYAQFCLLGPSTANLLHQLTVLDMGRAAFPAGSCAESGLAGVHALLVRPPGTALDTVHICVAWDLAEYIWERLLDAGRYHGIEPVGLEAWRRLT